MTEPTSDLMAQAAALHVKAATPRPSTCSGRCSPLARRSLKAGTNWAICCAPKPSRGGLRGLWRGAGARRPSPRGSAPQPRRAAVRFLRRDDDAEAGAARRAGAGPGLPAGGTEPRQSARGTRRARPGAGLLRAESFRHRPAPTRPARSFAMKHWRARSTCTRPPASTIRCWRGPTGGRGRSSATSPSGPTCCSRWVAPTSAWARTSRPSMPSPAETAACCGRAAAATTARTRSSRLTDALIASFQTATVSDRAAAGPKAGSGPWPGRACSSAACSARAPPWSSKCSPRIRRSRRAASSIASAARTRSGLHPFRRRCQSR